MTMSEEMSSEREINSLRAQILQMAQKSGEGHVPSSLSILDLLWVLYTRVLTTDPANPNLENRDRFFLSKGHASLGLYSVLSARGFFPQSELENFCEFESILGGHPDRLKVPGVEASTGSLGHGLPQAVGVALALKLKRNPSRVFALIGDGEANEGTIWESALLAAHHNLDNLVCILDFNHSTDRALQLGEISSKFKSFNWEVKEIDGHNHEQITESLMPQLSSKPLFLLAHTIKGKGFSVMENNPEWHHKAPNKEEMKTFLGELN